MPELDTVPTDFAPAICIAPAEGLENEEGGRIVATGTPEEIARNPESNTGRYLIRK